MRKLVLIVGLVVVAFACSSGGDMMSEIMDSGVPDADAQTGECPCEAGPQGEPGEQGLPGVGAVIWKDAEGNAIDRVVGIPNRYYFDPDGNVWALISADVLTVTEGSVGGSWSAYTSPNCTGTAYILSGTSPARFPQPRMTFTVSWDPDTIRVRPDDSAIQGIEYCSRLRDTGCEQINGGACSPDRPAINADDTVPETPLSIPTLSHPRPSHPELP